MPLQGVGFPGYTRLPRVPLRLPWAKRSLGFQPVVPDDPIVSDFARQTGHLKKFANSLIRENIYEHCWLFMAIPDHIFRPHADQYNPQMLNRVETDENPYNICLTSADK